MSNFQGDSIFWIEVEKIKPNPFQPRKEFSEDKLNYLAESIRQYGVLQPLVVTRTEVEKPDGGLMAEYELIAGERRLRASKIAGLSQVPAIIRSGPEVEDEGLKLELAIIENLQREDLNPIDRALAFQRLAEEFGLKHTEIGKKMGKSREYVSNSLRLLSLPQEMQDAISSTQITEGHARPLMMLRDRPEEQMTLFKEIIYKKLTVRDAEAIAKKVAYDKVRRKTLPPDPEMMELEGQLAESLGTRVQIERKEVGGKLTIDFFSNEDLKKILDLVHSNDRKSPTEMLDNYIQNNDIVKDSIPTQFTQTQENHPHSSVEEEVQNRPMTEITDTATDEIDEETQSEIQEEVKIVEKDFSQTPLEEKVEKVPTEELISSPVEGEKKTEQIVEVSSSPVETTQTSSEPIVEEKVSYMNVGQDFKMSTEPKKEESIPLNGGVEVIPATPEVLEKGNQYVENQNIHLAHPDTGSVVSGDVEITQGNKLEEGDVESSVPLDILAKPSNQNNQTVQKNEDDDLYSVKDFSI